MPDDARKPPADVPGARPVDDLPLLPRVALPTRVLPAPGRPRLLLAPLPVRPLPEPLPVPRPLASRARPPLEPEPAEPLRVDPPRVDPPRVDPVPADPPARFCGAPPRRAGCPEGGRPRPPRDSVIVVRSLVDGERTDGSRRSSRSSIRLLSRGAFSQAICTKETPPLRQRVRGGGVSRNPAATYSPRELPPKYHRRWRSSRPCSEWERVFPRRNCHRKPIQMCGPNKGSRASTSIWKKNPKPSAD